MKVYIYIYVRTHLALQRVVAMKSELARVNEECRRLEKRCKMLEKDVGDDAAQLRQEDITETVLARLRSGAIVLPGPELDLRAMKVDRLSDRTVASLARTRGVRPWEPEQLLGLWHQVTLKIK